MREENFGDRLGVGKDLGRVISESLSVDLLERDGDSSDRLVVRIMRQHLVYDSRKEHGERTLLWGPP